MHLREYTHHSGTFLTGAVPAAVPYSVYCVTVPMPGLFLPFLPVFTITAARSISFRSYKARRA